MVGGHPLDFPGTDEIGAGIADVGDGDFVTRVTEVDKGFQAVN